MMWVRLMNNIKFSAEEIVLKNMAYAFLPLLRTKNKKVSIVSDEE